MQVVVIPNARDGFLHSNVFGVLLPANRTAEVASVITASRERHGGYLKVGIDLPSKPRTLRASAKLHGMIGCLASILNLSLGETKTLVKEEAVAIGYPTEVVMIGSRAKVIPQSEARASTQDEHLLIEAVNKLGAEAGHDLEAEYLEKRWVMKGMA